MTTRNLHNNMGKLGGGGRADKDWLRGKSLRFQDGQEGKGHTREQNSARFTAPVRLSSTQLCPMMKRAKNVRTLIPSLPPLWSPTSVSHWPEQVRNQGKRPSR